MSNWVEICDLVEKSPVEKVAVTTFKMGYSEPTVMMKKSEVGSLFENVTEVECYQDGSMVTIVAGNNVIVFPS